MKRQAGMLTKLQRFLGQKYRVIFDIFELECRLERTNNLLKFHAVFYMLAEGPGGKLKETMGSELGSLFLLAVVFISLTMFYKRQFTAFIGFALFAMLVSVFVFQPELVETLGSDAFRWLFVEWFENLN